MRAAGSPGTEPIIGRDETSRDAGNDISREAWAATFLATLRQEVLGRATPEAMTSAPHQPTNDVGLTAASGALDAPLGEGAQAEASPTTTTSEAGNSKNTDERLEFEFDAGRLGKVSLGIMRRNGALEVVVGVEDLRQMALVDLERAALTASLKAAGLNISSVSVMSLEQAGIAFAQPKRGVNVKPQATANQAYRDRRVRQETDADEGLNLVG